MKKTILIISALTLAQGAFSQDAPTGVTGITGGIGGAVIVQQPGVYDQQKLDRTAIIMQSMSTVDVANKLMISRLIAKGEDAIEALRQLVNGGDGRRSFQQIQKEGLAQTRYLDISEFVELRGILNDNLSRADQAINTLNTLNEKDGKASLTIEGKIIELPALAAQKVGEVAKVLSAAANQIKGQADGMVFRVVGGAVQGGAPTTLKLSDNIPATLIQIAGSQLQTLRANAEAKLKAPQALSAKDKVFSSSRALNTEVRSRIDAIIKVMGKGNVGQIWNLNKDGMANVLHDLQEVMIARTTLRYQFGTPIGAIGVNYKKYWLNLDQIMLGNQIEFLPNDIYTYSDLVQVQDNNKLQYEKAQRKSQEVFGKGVPLLSRILSGINKITLREAWGQVNTFIMDMLVQDVDQEIMMNSAMGREKLYADLEQHLAASPDWAKEVKPFIKTFVAAIETPNETASISSANFSQLFQQSVSSLQGWQSIWLEYVLTIKTINDSNAGMSALVGGKKAKSLSTLAD